MSSFIKLKYVIFKKQTECYYMNGNTNRKENIPRQQAEAHYSIIPASVFLVNFRDGQNQKYCYLWNTEDSMPQVLCKNVITVRPSGVTLLSQLLRRLR